jgi:hypothetical protein
MTLSGGTAASDLAIASRSRTRQALSADYAVATAGPLPTSDVRPPPLGQDRSPGADKQYEVAAYRTDICAGITFAGGCGVLR